MVNESSQVTCPITTKLVLDEDEETKEPIVHVHRNLVTKLKPHQVDGKERVNSVAQKQQLSSNMKYVKMLRCSGLMLASVFCFFASGVQFMWDCCCESVKKIEKSSGSGCILAHCMGLGKTLQVRRRESEFMNSLCVAYSRQQAPSYEKQTEVPAQNKALLWTARNTF